MDGMQPGQVIVPQGPDDDPPQAPPQPSPGAPEPVRQPEEAPEPIPAPTQTPGPATVSRANRATADAQTQTKQLDSEDAAGWRYNKHADTGSVMPSQVAPEENITWTASEFITHEKSPAWYAAVVSAGLVAATVDYVLLKDAFSSIIILFAAIAFTAISARKPRTQQYTLTYQGLQIGNKLYYFQDFKNFSVAEDGAIASIVFMPMRRFMPSLTIYVAPDMEDQVIDFLSSVLPFEQHSTDAVDSLMRRIRF